MPPGTPLRDLVQPWCRKLPFSWHSNRWVPHDVKLDLIGWYDVIKAALIRKLRLTGFCSGGLGCWLPLSLGSVSFSCTLSRLADHQSSPERGKGFLLTSTYNQWCGRRRLAAKLRPLQKSLLRSWRFAYAKAILGS